MFGFGYPARAITLEDDDGVKVLENFEIVPASSRGGVTMVRIHDPGPVPGEVFVAGDHMEWKPASPAEIWRVSGLLFGLLAWLTYTILIFMPDPLLTPLLLIICVYAWYMIYIPRIQHIHAILKGHIGGTPLYVPAAAAYLTPSPSPDVDLEGAAVRAATSKLRSLDAENRRLLEETAEVAEKVDRAFLLGLRLRKTFLPVSAKLPAPIILILIFLAGIVLGYLLGGGVPVIEAPAG